jgi:predicted RNA methylase
MCYFKKSDIRQHPELFSCVADLRSGASVSDERFDQIFPKAAQKLSRTHWTCVQVATRASQWLVTSPDSIIADLGSGVGKFCLVGALTTQGQFIGVEVESPLVKLATALAKQYRITQAKFYCGSVAQFDWSRCQGVYLYNPFAHSIKLNAKGIEVDSTSIENYEKEAKAVYTQLVRQPPGFRAAVYCGYGGPRPEEYQLVSEERIRTGVLEFWERKA